jgi:hypothetical protein
MNHLSVYESLAILTYKHKLSLSIHKTLATWLDCYTYILPASRVLRESALNIRPQSHSDYLHLYNFLCILETNYSESEQSNIVREILCYPHRHQIPQM